MLRDFRALSLDAPPKVVFSTEKPWVFQPFFNDVRPWVLTTLPC